jgi:hypothetical protein
MYVLFAFVTHIIINYVSIFYCPCICISTVGLIAYPYNIFELLLGLVRIFHWKPLSVLRTRIPQWYPEYLLSRDIIKKGGTKPPYDYIYKILYYMPTTQGKQLIVLTSLEVIDPEYGESMNTTSV